MESEISKIGPYRDLPILEEKKEQNTCKDCRFKCGIDKYGGDWVCAATKVTSVELLNGNEKKEFIFSSRNPLPTFLLFHDDGNEKIYLRYCRSVRENELEDPFFCKYREDKSSKQKRTSNDEDYNFCFNCKNYDPEDYKCKATTEKISPVTGLHTFVYHEKRSYHFDIEEKPIKAKDVRYEVLRSAKKCPHFIDKNQKIQTKKSTEETEETSIWTLLDLIFDWFFSVFRK